jgi:hypothetical protein
VAGRAVIRVRLSIEPAVATRGTAAAKPDRNNVRLQEAATMKTIESNLLEAITGGAAPQTIGGNVTIQSGDPYSAYNACATTARTRGESQAGAAKFFHRIDPTGITDKELIKQGDARVAKECGWMVPRR